MRCAQSARRRIGPGVRRVGRGFVRRRGRDQAHRGAAVHPAADDGHHGPAAQGGRPARRRGATTRAEAGAAAPLAITTPEALPEAIAGRPYARGPGGHGGRGHFAGRWTGRFPDGLTFDPAHGPAPAGRPGRGRPSRSTLVLRVSDGDDDRHAGSTRLVVYQTDRPLTTPAWWKPGTPAGPLARLARSGVRVPRPLAGPPGRHERTLPAWREGDGAALGRARRRRGGSAGCSPALRYLPHALAAQHFISDAGSRRLALDRTLSQELRLPLPRLWLVPLGKYLSNLFQEVWPALGGKR